ncbi:hypothetical protein HNQ77_001644 [Silvibacterium bohemicum]|uniref:ATP-binding protein n=1 Tax=Silvibacterium bohemicum TaxID=1577686 RepID=A0A841JT76_9BACT|nr:ATP-binding protein [Silvibacterium bohemicum]MBB6143695.1 hypothetical protein [Silvibacterium bohemicum]
MSTIRAQISPTILSKADRLFRNDDAGVFVELLQNARRAGANRVDIRIEQLPGDACVSRVTFHDNGGGIDDFQKLLTLGDSDWTTDVRDAEDPAGMGFFSLCHSAVEVWSGHQRVVLSRDVFLGSLEAQVVSTKKKVPGTRIVFTRDASVNLLVSAARRVSEFGPIEVFINSDQVDRHDFLEGAQHREIIDGIDVGFGTSFRWQFGFNDENWNFHGALIREAFDSIPGLLRLDQFGRWQTESLRARFNVLEVGRVKLQLPDRRAIVQDERLREFERKVRAAAYRFFGTQDHHALAFAHWTEAQSLGVALREAAPLLKTWHAAPLDDGIDPFFGSIEEHFLPSLDEVLLVSRCLPNQHTLEAALQEDSLLDRELYQAADHYAGYSWYDALPLLKDTRVTVEGLPYAEWEKKSLPRPEKIVVTAIIKQSDTADAVVDLPAAIHVVDGDDVDWGDEAPVFVAVRNSPWDNDALAGPFDIAQFLFDATFRSSEDVEADSWDTQRDYYDAHVQREVDDYFRGPRAALMGILENSLSWDARRYAKQVGVQEIRFKTNGAAADGWKIELVFPDDQEQPLEAM